MKIKRFLVMLSILLLGIILTSCTSASATNSWGGVSANDTAVFFTYNTSVIAIKADTGSLIWTYPEKSAASRLFFAAPAVAGDQVIIGDYSGLLVGVGVRDGKERWQFTGAKGRYVDTPLVVNNSIVAQNADGKVYVLDMNGNLQWSFKGSGPFWATPVSDGTTFFAPSMDHNLYAVNLADGTLKWKLATDSALVAPAALASDGTLYMGSLEGTLYAVNTKEGTVKWKQTLSGGIWSAPILVGDNLYIGDQSGKIHVLKAADGSAVQTIDAGSAILGAGAVMNDQIVFGDEKGEVIVITQDGQRAWTRTMKGSIYSNLLYADNHLFVMPTKGDKPLYTYDATGNENWDYTPSK